MANRNSLSHSFYYLLIPFSFRWKIYGGIDSTGARNSTRARKARLLTAKASKGVYTYRFTSQKISYSSFPPHVSSNAPLPKRSQALIQTTAVRHPSHASLRLPHRLTSRPRLLALVPQTAQWGRPPFSAHRPALSDSRILLSFSQSQSRSLKNFKAVTIYRPRWSLFSSSSQCPDTPCTQARRGLAGTRHRVRDFPHGALGRHWPVEMTRSVFFLIMSPPRPPAFFFSARVGGACLRRFCIRAIVLLYCPVCLLAYLRAGFVFREETGRGGRWREVSNEMVLDGRYHH